MTDLNSSLTDFDKSLITEAPKPPELKPFSVWSEENQLAEADPQSYVQYSDYVREGYLNQGAYTPNIEEEISGSLNSKLADFGVVDEEGVQALTATKEPSFEEKFEYVRSSINSDEEDWKTLTDYKAGEEVVSAGGTVKPFQDKVAGLKERSEEIVNRRYNDVKRSLVESNQLPLAYVTNEEGQRELLVGDAAENMTVTQAIKASKLGGVSFKDGLVAQKLLSPIAGLDIKLYKFKKITEISEGIAQLAQQDASVAEHVTGHTRQLARKDRSAFDSVGATITRGVSDLLTFAGVESEESNAEKERIFLASHESFDNTVEYITEKLNASGANYNTKDVRDAYESHVINEGAKRGVFKLHQDPSEAGKNLYNTALGPVLNPAVFAREEDMINTLAAHPELTAQQKELFTKNRVDVLKQNFASYSKLLSESAVGDEWTEALVAGRQSGRDDLDIFDEFVAKDENFNEFTDSVKGIAYSVWDSVASLLYIAPAVMGADWAKDGLADASQRQSDRREVAQIFGEQYGLFQDVAESVAPLIVDVAATTALSSVTAGAGGAAYLAAKGGAQLTAKGLGKALTSNVLRATSEEGLEKVAGKAANVWIKESLETGGRAGTIKALQAYNSEVAKKFGVTVGTFVPAATRSGAMSYGSLYNQLRKDPDLTEEEAHDRALGFALTSGAITGVITSSFSALGRGGVEDALLKGMTFKESKKLFEAMGNTTGITNETVAAAMKKVVGDSIKKYGATTLGKKVVKNAVDEGLEEGVDQLVNSFVEDVALNQDTPMLERMKQVWHAAQVGGILGGGVPAVQAAASRLGVTPMDQLEQRIRVQNEFVEQVSSELEGTGSPLAARQVREIMMSRVRDRRPSAPEPEVPDTLTITDQKVKSEQNAKRTQEIAQEISKLDDQSTLPKKDEEREAEVAQRAQRRVELEQEGVALSEEQQNLRALEQAPATFGIPPVDQKVTPEAFIQSLNEASPLDVETAFENIRNQQNISFNNSEDTTVLKIEDTEAPPATETPFDYGVKTPRKIRDYSGRADIDFTKEQANAESAGVSLQGESRINIGSHNSSSRGFNPSVSKRYSSRPTSDTLRFDDPPFSGTNAKEKAIKLIDFAIANGFPVNLDPNVNYGLPLPSEASRQSVSEFVSSAVYTAYPKLAPPKNAKPYTSKQTAKTYFDPVSGKTVRQKVKGFVDDSGNGIFDNDPIVMIDMLKSGKLVKVPRSFGKANINPAIRIKDGVVVDVVGPTADGNLLESKVVDARHVSPIEPNNTRAAIIASIPFKKAELPAGVKDFDPLNGGPKSEDFADTTTIKRRIGVFSLELEKTGEEANRRVQSRLESNSGELSPEFRMAALESAKQEFLFNAQLISLREKLLANPATIINEVVAQTGSSNVNQAAQRLLPFIKVESNNNLTGSAILGLFVEQKLQNNPDFANNAPPTFDTLLAKAANRFKSQEETATSLRQQRAATTLPFDRTPSEFRNPKVSEWIANFGRNPEGDLASPEDISSAVSGAINTAIDAVNTDPDLRRAINKITLDHVLNDGTPEMADMVQTASARDIFGLFASWMSSGNGNTRESVTVFVEELELGIYPSSAEFQNALLLVNLANRSDGASYENSDAVNAYRDLFNAGAKQEIDTDQARNTMIALTKAVRTHLSRSNISSAERSAITAQNESDIQRLKLESGNPESVIEALKDVSKNSDNPSHKVVADLLLLDTDFLKKVKFVLGSATADIAGKYVKGLDGSHTVFINKTSGNGRGLVNTLLEEYVHAFISDITSATDAQIEGMPRGTKTRLKALSTVLTNSRTAYAKQKKESGPVPALENALVDLNEFAAQFLLSEDVQKHVRSLVPPPNRSSFFSRFLTNIVMLFPKAGAKDVKEAAKALEDVLDVGSNTRKTAPTDPKVLGGSLAGKALFSSPVTRSKEELLDLQREAENARLEANSREVEALAEEFLASVPEADRPKMGNLLNYVRGLLPLGMDMKITTESDGSSAFVTSDSSMVFVNPIAMLKQAGDISDAASRAIIGTIINEELTHTASFNALSMEEVQAYIDSLSESDFVDIAKEYHGDNDDGLKTTLAQLNSEDPSVVADARYRMAEEKLRMHLQKVTRGFTTEDDTQFWKSKPSLLGMLGRYFRGIINRWVAKREQIGPAADVALNKLIIEMRAIEVGFVRQPTKMPFDPETPMNVFRMFGTVNQNFVALASASVDTDQPVAGFPPLFSERTGKLSPVYDQSKDPTKQLRPEGQAELARRLAFGRITPEEYQEEYDRRFGAPEMSEDIPKPATQKEIFDALDGESKKSKTSLPEDVPADRYKVRLDIPAYTKRNVWVVTLHEDTSKMTPLAYTPSAVLDNVTFSVNQKAAAGIALKTGKGSIATMDGDYQPLPAKEAESLAKDAMNSTEWVEIGMNPYRHSYFYDKANQEPLVSAEQVIQVGGTVFAKGAKFGNRTETLEDGSRRFLYSAPVSAAAPSGQPTGTGIDFSAVVDLLEAPVYEIETEQPKNFIMKFLTEMFAGQLPEAFRRLVQNRDAYKRLTESNVIAYKTEMDKLIKDTYGSYDNAPMEMIARAQGYYSGNVVTEEVLNGIEEAYDKAHAAAEADRKAGNITDGEADTLKSIADKIRTNDTNKAYDAAVKVREADRDAALRDLAKESPKLAAHIIDIREKLIIPLQKKLVKSGLDSKIGVKISKTGGIYVTRSYQMFTDSSYLEKVKTDPNYQKVRDAAMEFFATEFVKKTTKDLVNSGMDPSLAKIEAGKILERENQSSPHNSYGQEALNAFLMQYEKGGRDSTTLAPKDYKMIEDNLKRRRDLPEEIRDLLGELGPKSGIDLILRTYSTVATLTSQQAFLNQLKDFGEKSGVMVTTENRFATKENRDKYSNFVPARSGVPSKSDPLSGMHVSPEFKEALDVTLKDSYMMDYADTAEKAVKGIFGLASNLSGKAMAAKTLGSIGFYGRNAVGNLLFGTSQGFFRYDKMISAMTKSSIDAFTGASGKIDPVVSELIGLNVMGDELRAGVMRDLLNGKVTPEGIRKQIAELGEKTKLIKLTKGLAFIEKKAQDLSAALDAAYKVAYYNHELNILKEAQAADTGKGTVDLAAMEDTEIKRLAARKVVMTSQAYSQAPPAVAAFTKSGLGLVFAPFIRFKMEVPRIVINTFKLAKEEIDSKNPVLVRRGVFRMGSMIGTLGVLSSAVPMIMAALSGIGDEEDEAMRASIPDYLRGHTFFYFGEGKNLKSIDLTYVNPYSLIVDPFLRSYENIRRGEFTEAGAALAIGFVRDQYLDDQILAGAVRDATRNVNPSTGKPIWNNGADGPVEAGSKILSYIAKEAYAPRLGKDFVNGWATGSLSGMIGEISDGAMPARIHDVDLQKQYSRYLLDLNKRFNNVKSGLNAVKRNAPMSDGEVADIIDDNIEDRRLLNYELMRINKGFSSLGLTDTDLLKGMKEMKLGRDRVALLSRGYMDRPSPKYIIESLLDPRTDEYGEGRAQQILNHYRSINRYIPVRPITESE